MFGLPDGVTACLFDMDGVVTQTAVVHAAAWKEMFDEFLRSCAESTGTGFVPFDPHAEAVFEDALAGVEAGRAGHFALVVGVDRVGQAEELSKHGADIVVRDLAELLDAGGQPGEGVR
jgi:beta-phosphoglucomutase-like phosphatase (HAD superfamily)